MAQSGQTGVLRGLLGSVGYLSHWHNEEFKSKLIFAEDWTSPYRLWNILVGYHRQFFKCNLLHLLQIRIVDETNSHQISRILPLEKVEHFVFQVFI